jgi:PAS domain S-box-containing protein
LSAPDKLERGAPARSITAFVRDNDWTALGMPAPAEWPPALQSVLKVVLDFPSPAVLLCGPEAVVIYNDYFAHLALDLHPRRLGSSAFAGSDAGAAAPLGAELARDVLSGRAVSRRGEVLATGRGAVALDLDYVPVRDEAGAVIGAFGVVREQAAGSAESALSASEEQYRMILESARDFAIVMTDVEGRITTWNPGAVRIFDYRAEEVLGQDITLIFTPEDQAAHVSAIELETAAREGRANDERWQMRKDGSRFWASGVTTSMRNAAGELRGFTKVLRDLTAQKRLEEERERLLERERLARFEAERAMVVRDEFLAVLTHELRTPLSAVVLWSKMLRTGLVAAADQGRALEAIEEGATAQQRLIDELLDLSRMGSGKLRLELRKADPVAAIRRAVEIMRPIAEGKSISIELAVPENTAPIPIDADRVQQVVWNLLHNAVKFSHRGGHVRIAAARQDEWFRIQVSDRGRGIDRNFLPYVFERFRQADASNKRTEGGLGLGLAISRQLVELHGGTIVAESPGLGRGATFTITLPVEARERAMPTPAPIAATATSPPITPELAGARILFVEDDPRTREAVTWTLRRWSADVTAAESPDEAMRAFEESLSGRPFDVLVTDIAMPKRDGYDLLADMRALERQRKAAAAIPAVALTAYVREEDRARALAAGFRDYVSKPVDPTRLYQTIASIIHGNQSPPR